MPKNNLQEIVIVISENKPLDLCTLAQENIKEWDRKIAELCQNILDNNALFQQWLPEILKIFRDERQVSDDNEWQLQISGNDNFYCDALSFSHDKVQNDITALQDKVKPLGFFESSPDKTELKQKEERLKVLCHTTQQVADQLRSPRLSLWQKIWRWLTSNPITAFAENLNIIHNNYQVIISKKQEIHGNILSLRQNQLLNTVDLQASEIKKLNDDNNDIYTMLQEKDAELAELTRQVNEQGKVLQARESNSAIENEVLKKQTENILTLTDQNLESELSHISMIEHSGRQREEDQRKIAKLEEKLNNAEINLRNREQEYNEKEITLEKNIQSLEKTQKQKLTEIEKLQSQLKEQPAKISDLVKGLNDKQTVITQLEQEKRRLTEESKDFHRQIQLFQTQLKQKTDELNTRNKRSEDYQNQVQLLQTQSKEQSDKMTGFILNSSKNQETIVNLKQALKDMQKEKNSAATASDQAQAQKLAEIANLKMQLDEKKTKVSQLDEGSKEKQARIIELERELKVEQEKNSSAAMTSDQAQAQKLAEIANLKMQLDEQKTKVSQLDEGSKEKQARIVELERELKAEQEKNSSAAMTSDQAQAQKLAEIANLKMQLDEQKTKVSQLDEGAKGKQSKIIELEQVLDAAEKEKSSATENIAILQQQSNKFKNESEILCGQLAASKGALELAQEDNKNSREAVQKVEKEIVLLKEEGSQLRRTIDQKSKENSLLRENLKKATAGGSETQQQLGKLTQENAALQRQIIETRDAGKKLRASLTLQETTNKRKADENVNLRGQLNKQTAELEVQTNLLHARDTELEKKAKEVDALKQQFEKAKQEKENIAKESKDESVKNQDTIKALEAKINNAETDLHDWEQKYNKEHSDLESAKKVEKTQKQKLAEMEILRGELKQQTEAMSKFVTNAQKNQAEILDLKQKIKITNSEKNTAIDNNVTLQQQFDKFKKELELAQKSMDQLTNDNKNLQQGKSQEGTKMQQQLAELSEKNKNLKNQLSEKTKEADAAEQRIEALRKSHDEKFNAIKERLKEEDAKMNEEIQGLKQQRAKLSEEKESLKNQLSGKTKVADDAEQTIKALRKQFKEEVAEITERIRAEHDKMVKEKEDLINQLSEKTKVADDAEQTVKALKEQLEQIQSSPEGAKQLNPGSMSQRAVFQTPMSEEAVGDSTHAIQQNLGGAQPQNYTKNVINIIPPPSGNGANPGENNTKGTVSRTLVKQDAIFQTPIVGKRDLGDKAKREQALAAAKKSPYRRKQYENQQPSIAEVKEIWQEVKRKQIKENVLLAGDLNYILEHGAGMLYVGCFDAHSESGNILNDIISTCQSWRDKNILSQEMQQTLEEVVDTGTVALGLQKDMITAENGIKELQDVNKGLERKVADANKQIQRETTTNILIEKSEMFQTPSVGRRSLGDKAKREQALQAAQKSPYRRVQYRDQAPSVEEVSSVWEEVKKKQSTENVLLERDLNYILGAGVDMLCAGCFNTNTHESVNILNDIINTCKNWRDRNILPEQIKATLEDVIDEGSAAIDIHGMLAR